MTSPNHDEDGADVGQFIEALRQAEKAIKTAEVSVHIRPQDIDEPIEIYGPFLPAINELRYASWHIANYLEQADVSSLNKAIAHCRRAEFDAYDCGIQFFVDECRRFQDDYKNVTIASVVSDYSRLTLRVNQIARNPATRDIDLSQAILQKRQDFQDLAEIYALFQSSRDELNKLVRVHVRSRNRWILGLTISLIGLAATLIMLFRR